MKAEHRKELETNVLADRMGRLVQRMKTKPRGRSVLYAVLGIVVLIGLFIAYRFHLGTSMENTFRWRALEDGREQILFGLAGMEETTQGGKKRIMLSSTPDPSNPGKAARFHMARFFLWDQGVRLLGVNSTGALQSIRFAEDIYKTLLKDCEKDPDFYPEALYGLAVVEETRAMQNQERLVSAQKQYEDLAENHKDSGFAVLARKRAKELKENSRALTQFYRDLQTKFRIPDEKVLDKLEKALP